MDEKIQCEFYLQANSNLERCKKPYTNLYKLEDGSTIKVCDDHLLLILERMEVNNINSQII